MCMIQSNSNTLAKISSQIPQFSHFVKQKTPKKSGLQQPCYFSYSNSQRLWLAFYGHRKLRDSQLPILQSQIAHMLEPTFCYTNSKIVYKTRQPSCWSCSYRPFCFDIHLTLLIWLMHPLECVNVVPVRPVRMNLTNTSQLVSKSQCYSYICKYII